jgi:outer membrane receptor protein involved in Fe transport
MILLGASVAHAQIFGTVRVTVTDPQNKAVPEADVVLHSRTTQWGKSGKSDAAGQIQFDTVPVGQYIISVDAQGFAIMPERGVEVNSDATSNVQVQLSVGAVSEEVQVTASEVTVNPESSTTETLTNRTDIVQAPGADRTGSMAMITNNVPGTYVMHDHLHSRGGHGVAWEIDGVPVPNSNLASVGSQFDPKDVEYLETQRGGYSAQYGDRSYGVFNVVPRNGFEGNRFGEFQTTYGSLNQTNSYLALGSHTDRFAYFGSLAGSRTDMGLERPDIQILHDQASAFSGFTSLVFNKSDHDQLRFVGSVRQQHYQVPNVPDQQYSLEIRDTESVQDVFTNFSWIHTPSSGVTLTAAPYFHYNRGRYVGGPNDNPLSPYDDHSANYVGGYITLAVNKAKNSVRVGEDSYAEHDNTIFGLTANNGSGLSLQQTQALWAGLFGVFVQDQYKVTSWLTANAGLRYTRFSGTLTEGYVDPRLGLAIQVPRVGWVLRGSYGHYYQHPPLNTIAGPLLQFALQQGFNFLPVRGERDETWEVGLAVPLHKWSLDFDHFHNRARNAVDHDVLGNSNLLFPVSLAQGRIQGWESTVRSPELFRRLQVHMAFSRQVAQAQGPISGGLLSFVPPPGGWFYMDHDQRYTVNTGFELTMPWHAWSSATVLYGSGFVRGDGVVAPTHMPQHTTLDLAVGKDFEPHWSVRATALNVANNTYLTGVDSSFAGTHYSDPRQVIGQVMYRFHF